MEFLSSWGRLSSDPHQVFNLSSITSFPDALTINVPGLPFGMGRSYGDICLNPNGAVWKTTKLNKFISFDTETGTLCCEAGVTLYDIQKTFVKQGWMLPVTPGTQFVTVGGAIANDVHGKNHHVMGSFGDHIRSLNLMRTTGEIITCEPFLNSEWFFATVGGMGLTGTIIQAEIQLRKTPGAWLETETIPYYSLEEFFHLADDSESEWEYTVSWIDCLSKKGVRGLFMRGNHKDVGDRFDMMTKTKKMPFVSPISLVNRLTLKPFNATYFYANSRKKNSSVTHYKPFFYPLDNIQDWNKMYGSKGFYQYQCVVPRENGIKAIGSIINAIAHSNEGSFLSVLKTFGKRKSLGMMGFPQEGVTLAMDFPNKGHVTLSLLDRLDKTLKEAGGKLYLAKDSRMSRDFFEQSYPRLEEFKKFRDPGISSAMSRRLIGI